MTRPSSPQEKKRLSYEHDRRNRYCEHSKSSRRGIRLRKQSVNRSNRHADRIVLQATDPLTGEPTASVGKVHRPERWSKVPDAPLGDAVIKKLQRRARLGIATPSSVERAIRKVRSTRANRNRNHP